MDKQTIVFRVDSGEHIGIGHIMRCLTLADYFKDNIQFICKNHKGNIISKIREKYNVHSLPISNKKNKGIDLWLGTTLDDDCESCIQIVRDLNVKLLVIDHYSIDHIWETKIKPYINGKILVIDDIFNRYHNANILLDQNLYDTNPYKELNLVPSHCKILLGPKYSLLNKNFNQRKVHSGKIKRINIFYGGSDIYDLTSKTLEFLEDIDLNNKQEIIIDVVIGLSNPHYNKIVNLSKILKSLKILIHYNVENMAKLLLKADLCFGSTGISCYERGYIGIPSIVITFANNQIPVAKYLEKIGAIIYLGDYVQHISENNYTNTLSYYFPKLKSVFKNLLISKDKLVIMNTINKNLITKPNIQDLLINCN